MSEDTTKVTVIFRKLIQDSQQLGSDDDHMVSRVFFDVDYGGRRHTDAYVDVKQAVGGDVEKDPLEVGRAHGYSGPGNYQLFRVAVEQYFRDLIGSLGVALQVKGTNIRMRDNVVKVNRSVRFPVTPAGGW